MGTPTDADTNLRAATETKRFRTLDNLQLLGT